MEQACPAFEIDAAGWCSAARRFMSPNFDARPAGGEVDLVVMHAISLPPGQFGGPWVDRLFGNSLPCGVHPYFDSIRHLRVSAHFLIGRDGELTQYVATTQRAWHAGVSSWRGRDRCNDFSVGIELEGCDERPFDAVQYEVAARLLRALQQRHPIRDIVGHSDVAPGRKTDPGPCFDWNLLRSLRGAPSPG